MRIRLAGAVVAVAILWALSVPASQSSEQKTAPTFEIDGVHSVVIFRIKHLNTSQFYGRFNDVSGTFSLDRSNPSAARFDIEIKTASADTHNERRDKHICGPDFLNAKQFPVATFKAVGAKKTGDATFEVTGELTLHGVTRSITASIEYVGESEDRRGGYRMGFECILNIKRSDFGMDYMLNGLGDEMRLIISIEGIRK